MRALLDAQQVADRTPVTRNRYVDMLRAVSILVVVLGHWTTAAVTMRDGEFVMGHLLVLAPWTHPLTWVFQVMPVFFLVGGYANALSWRAARRRGEGYGAWLRARVRRLALPVVPVLLAWTAAAAGATVAGVDVGTLRLASTVALVPTWFLAAYLLVVAVAPATLVAWERWRWWTLLAGTLAAGVVDLVSLTTESLALGFLNYLVVWASVHQLGYAWVDGALGGRRRAALVALGLGGLVLLVTVGPYPVAMVGVDTATVNNTFPTRVTMLLLGLLQTGVVLALEPAGRRLAALPRVWAAVVVANTRIMTVYLWHVTAMVLVIGASLLSGGRGLHADPLGATWWLTRPVWFAVLGAVTGGLVMLLGRWERPVADPRPSPPWWRPAVAVAGTCGGLAALALEGIADTDGLHVWPVAVPLVALAVGGVVRPPQWLRRQ